MKLGRLPHDAATLARLPQAAPHLDAAAPGCPSVIDWSRDVALGAWGVFLNDQLGDCTCAAVAHAIILWSATASPVGGAPCRWPNSRDVLALYEAVAGYVPGRSETDRGARCADVLAHWCQCGIGCDGAMDRLAAYAVIDPRNHAHVRTALWALGAVYAGVLLHEAQETEAVWSDLSSPVMGGHCVLLVAADNDGLTCVTWGELRRMTWGWWDAAAEEAYALLSPNWLAAGRAPQGFPAAALQAEMLALSARPGMHRLS